MVSTPGVATQSLSSLESEINVESVTDIHVSTTTLFPLAGLARFATLTGRGGHGRHGWSRLRGVGLPGHDRANGRSWWLWTRGGLYLCIHGPTARNLAAYRNLAELG